MELKVVLDDSSWSLGKRTKSQLQYNDFKVRVSISWRIYSIKI